MGARPERTCFGCGRKAGKEELIRLSLSLSGQVAVDFNNRAGGRGVYVCPEASCLKKAGRRKLPEALRRRGAAAEFGRTLAELETRLSNQGRKGDS